MVMLIFTTIWLLMFFVSVVCFFVSMFSIDGFLNRDDVHMFITISCFLTAFGLAVIGAIFKHEENKLLKTKLEFCEQSFDTIRECEEYTLEGLKSEDDIVKLQAEKIYIKHIRKTSNQKLETHE